MPEVAAVKARPLRSPLRLGALLRLLEGKLVGRLKSRVVFLPLCHLGLRLADSGHPVRATGEIMKEESCGARNIELLEERGARFPWVEICRQVGMKIEEKCRELLTRCHQFSLSQSKKCIQMDFNRSVLLF